MDIRNISIELQNQIIDLYINQKVKPADIAERLGFSHHQPIYTFLKKRGIFKKYLTGDNFVRTYSIDETFFEVIDSEVKSYVLGFIAADGFVDEVRNSLKISLNIKDVDVLEKIKTSLSSEHPIRHFIKDGKYNHVSIDMCSKKIVGDLKKFNLHRGKSLTMTGQVINHVPPQYVRDFLRGYFDGDGCIHYGHRYSSGVKFNLTVVGTKDFLEKTFSEYCYTNCKIFKYSSCNMYGWRVSSKGKVDNCLEYLYKDSVIHLDRKYNQYLATKQYVKECAHVKPEELLETLSGQSAAEPALQEGSETIEKQSQD
jgi:intein-encoded DNA endonuclease-like protein